MNLQKMVKSSYLKRISPQFNFNYKVLYHINLKESQSSKVKLLIILNFKLVLYVSVVNYLFSFIVNFLALINFIFYCY